MKTSSKNQINRILTSSIPWTSKIIVQLHKQFRLPVFLFGLLVVTFFLFSKQENTIDSLKERYNQSLQLIQELKHSTDELTKISRQYIITGDKKYREQYSEILAIREGILPRPVNLDYLSIEYTDSKKASKNNGKPIALSALIIKTNLTKNELQLFNSAKNLSDQISNIEIKSMDLIESKNLSNLSQLKKKAIEDLHSDSFVQLTLNAVKPLKELQKIFDDKFLIEISKAEEILIGLRISLMLINLFFILSLWHIYFKFHSAIGAPLSDVQRYLEQIGNGDFITPIHVPIEMQGTILDQVSKAKTSLAKMDSYRKQVERLEIFRSEIFELLIQQTDLSTILLNIVNGVEKLYPNMICSILRLDAEGTHLGQVIAPSLPDFYNKAIDGLKIGDGVGSCGTAAYLGKRVEVDDIQSHPYWAKFKGLAEEADLGSCWSQPFFDSTGKVLGTFAIYHRNSYQLTDLEITTIDLSSQLVSIAIDHTESQNRLVTVYQRLNNLIEAIPDAIFFKDPESRWLITNDPAKQLFKLHDIPWQDKKEMEIAELHPDFWAAHEACLVDDEVTWKNRDITIFSETVLDENGNKKFFEVRKKPIFDDKGERQGLVIIGRDITERVQSEEKLHLAANVFTHAREGISITDADGTIIDVNDTFTRITGYSREEVIGKNPRILSSGMQSKEFYISLWESLFDKGYWFGEIWNRRKNGEFYAEMLTISAVHDTKGKIQNFVALFSDITSAKEYEKQLEHIAHHDVLTGLPNRVLLSSRLEHVMLQTKKNNQSLAVVYCDLDGFKVINDNYGHDTGDRLLMALANRMKEALNETDTLARIGGDEFVASYC
jgi:PAS domain S-box-containing protein